MFPACFQEQRTGHPSYYFICKFRLQKYIKALKPPKVFVSSSLLYISFHPECYMIACHIVLGKGEIDGLHHQHLAGDGEADART